MSYVSLREKSRFLKSVTTGASKELRPDEITSAEAYADIYIEGKLGKTWDSGDNSGYPQLIVQVADMLASATCWLYLHTGNSPKQSNYAEVLEGRADKILNAIISGDMGIKLPDGTWDDDFPGPNQEDKQEDSLNILA